MSRKSVLLPKSFISEINMLEPKSSLVIDITEAYSVKLMFRRIIKIK